MKSLYLIPYTKNRIITLYFLEILNSKYKSVELIKVTDSHKTIEKYEKSNADFILFEGNLKVDNKILAENLQSGVIGVFEEKSKELKIDNYLGSIVIPKLTELEYIPFNQLIEELNLEVVLKGDFQKDIKGISIASMGVNNFLEFVQDDELVVVGFDRNDIMLSCESLLLSNQTPNPSALLLTGNSNPKIINLLNDFPVKMPILATNKSTSEITKEFYNLTPNVEYLSREKLLNIFAKLDKFIDKNYFLEKLKTPTNEITPLIFKYKLYEKAKQNKKRVVLDELDDRILKAAEIVMNKNLADIIFVGDEKEFKNRAKIIGVNIDKAQFINHKTSKYRNEFIEEFYNLKKHKGITKDRAAEIMEESIYFATMLVQKGYADGLVSGAIHTTANTIRPALQIIKTNPNTPLVSSLFFMLLEDKVLVFADCAVNEKPTAEELAIIAITTHDTAKQFSIEPKVALLSYSTKGSGSGKDVEKVTKALEIIKSKRSDVLIDGPLQYDAAINKEVANKKAPNSPVAGEANVLIFPDLDTGNITYKAVQRSAGAIAIGPVLQGLKKPANDLSRGCLVEDVIDTIVVTAVQAQTS
jgi:phosphate acetyltransferase